MKVLLLSIHEFWETRCESSCVNNNHWVCFGIFLPSMWHSSITAKRNAVVSISTYFYFSKKMKLFWRNVQWMHFPGSFRCLWNWNRWTKLHKIHVSAPLRQNKFRPFKIGPRVKSTQSKNLLSRSWCSSHSFSSPNPWPLICNKFYVQSDGPQFGINTIIKIGIKRTISDLTRKFSPTMRPNWCRIVFKQMRFSIFPKAYFWFRLDKS